MFYLWLCGSSGYSGHTVQKHALGGDRCGLDLGLKKVNRTGSVRVVTDFLPPQQRGSDSSEGASAKHGGPRGCLLFSVQQKSQPAQRPGGPAEESEGEQVGCVSPLSSQQLL